MALVKCSECGGGDQRSGGGLSALRRTRAIGIREGRSRSGRGQGGRGTLSRTLFIATLVAMALYTGLCAYFGIRPYTDELASGPVSDGTALGMGIAWIIVFVAWALGMIVLGLLALVFKPRARS